MEGIAQLENKLRSLIPKGNLIWELQQTSRGWKNPDPGEEAQFWSREQGCPREVWAESQILKLTSTDQAISDSSQGKNKCTTDESHPTCLWKAGTQEAKMLWEKEWQAIKLEINQQALVGA